MKKLTDAQIRAWIHNEERFEGRSVGGGLYIRYRAVDRVPTWRLRYSFAGKDRVMTLGKYGVLSLAEARKTAREMMARVALGFDVATEKKARKAEAVALVEREKNAVRVSELAAEYYERRIMTQWKNHDIFLRGVRKDINPVIGQLKVEDVKPRHIDDMLQRIIARGAPTVANDVLRWVQQIFNYGIKRQLLENNPAAAFNAADAGGKETSRERWLTRDELRQFFRAMRMAKGFSRTNELTMMLILCLACRKMELCAARWDEFDLDGGIWHLPGERVKNGDGVDIPLPPVAVEWLRELQSFTGSGCEWVLPARKAQHRMIPHIQESTLSVALAKVRREMPDVPNFTIHDFRRTARTHLAAMGVDPVVAERYLNHRIKGVEGIYNRHQYLRERRAAGGMWANLLVELAQE